jgi:hypothetical protein
MLFRQGGLRRRPPAVPVLHGSKRRTLPLQDNLLVRARLEAEDAQRALLGALNGLAGLMLLDGKGAEAVATFREVLSIGAPLLPLPRAMLRAGWQLSAQCYLSGLRDGLAPPCHETAHWNTAGCRLTSV